MGEGESIPVQIRPAVVGDMRGLAETHMASWRATYRGLIPDSIIDKHTVESRAAAWGKTLGDPSHNILVAIIDAQVVGFACYGPCRDKGAGPAQAELMAIYVHPDYLRRGVGRALCERMLANLRPAFREIIVWVLRENPAARRFYEGMNFSLVQGAEKQLPWFGNVPEVCYSREV